MALDGNPPEGTIPPKIAGAPLPADDGGEIARLAARARPDRADSVSIPDATTTEIAADKAEIARLAMLLPIECDRELPAAAERLGCRVPTLRAEVRAARGYRAAIPGQGRPLELHEPDPWPELVDGAALLDEMARAVRRYVVLDPPEAEATALWVLGTHAFDAWTIFPRLFARAPEKQCGKTTLLDVLSRLVPRKLIVDDITAAALFRTIEAARPTLLLDEADGYVRDHEDLRSVLNAGHRRDGTVIRTVGENYEPRQFSVWAPVALAAIGHLPGTIEDRSIFIRLRRRRADEPVASLRGDRAGALDELARRAARWAAEHWKALAAADPLMPDGIYNRPADNWRPLLAIADEAGGDWPERARRTAVELSRQDDDSESARVQLLGDLREMFDKEQSGVLFTKEILAALQAREDRRWSEYGKAAKPITGPQVAALLKPVRITTNQTVRRRADTGKGYRRDWFDDAFARYLRGSESVTRSQATDSAAFNDSRSVTPGKNVVDTTCENPRVSPGCDRVTVRNPLCWRDHDGEGDDRDSHEATWTE